MKAIETRYNGRRYRSRLEARWAVFHDHVGIAARYEDEGFHLPGNILYLPDFYIPALDCWVELKPGTLSGLEAKKCALLASESGKRVFAFCGLPEMPADPYANPPRAVGFFGHADGYVEEDDGWSWGICCECGPVMAWWSHGCPRCGGGVDENADVLRAAYAAAADARFEHGETPLAPHGMERPAAILERLPRTMARIREADVRQLPKGEGDVA